MNKTQEIFDVDPAHLTRISADSVKVGDVIKCTCHDGEWDYRFISTVRERIISGIWRKDRNGDAGGCGLPTGSDWTLERVEQPALNRIRAFYNEIRLEKHALHCMVTFRRGLGLECREITATGDDLWLQVEHELNRLEKTFGRMVSMSHAFLPLD